MCAQVVELGIGLVTTGLQALEGLELEVLVGRLDVDGEALALRVSLGAALDDAMEGLELDHRGVASALVRLQVVELSVRLCATGNRTGEDTSSQSLARRGWWSWSGHAGGRSWVFGLVGLIHGCGRREHCRAHGVGQGGQDTGRGHGRGGRVERAGTSAATIRVAVVWGCASAAVSLGGPCWSASGISVGVVVVLHMRHDGGSIEAQAGLVVVRLDHVGGRKQGQGTEGSGCL